MNIFISLSSLALRQVVDGACAAVGVKESGEAVVGFLVERFTDHSQRLTKALQTANDNAWKALEIALAGDSLWDRCKATLARAEDKAFAQQVRAFLDATPLPELAGKTAFRQKCLEELRVARKGQILAAGTLDPRQLAQGAADFARFADPTRLLAAEWQMVVGLAGQVKQAGLPNLAWLLSQRPQEGRPLLVAGVRYFFRRAVEDDQKLFQGLSFARLEALGEAQERGFTALSSALTQQGQRLEELLGDVKAVLVQTHSAVLDLQGQMKGQGEQIQQIGQAVMQLLDQHQLQRRELRPADSMSIRNEGERKIVKQLVERYRALPETERQRLPALLNAVGKLEVVTGDFAAAQQDFQQVATLVADTAAQAEAHFNAYRTALERRDWDTALRELLIAVKLDSKRFAPFPVGKYHPQRILGAGGFGVAFSCRHKELKADVVVKTLVSDDLEREVDEVFNEARVLYQLDHPAIIRLLDCGYTIPAEKVRPYFVMNFFEGVTLEEQVQKHGPLSPDDMIAVASLMAEGLEAAHSKKILHRDVKPANVLVRKDASGWQVKVIDFGLALKHQVIEGAASTAKQKQTIVASSIAGTLDYGAPEQMGRLPGVSVGPASDIYGWAKTCCFGLFRTTEPLPKHWKSIAEPLADLLEDCLAENPKDRPGNFIKVLERIGDLILTAPNLQGGLGTTKTAEKLRMKADADEAPTAVGKQQKIGRRIWPWAVALSMMVVAVAVAVFVAMRPGTGKNNSGADNKTNEQDKKKTVVVQLPDFQMTFVWIPPGTFVMGSPETELQREAGSGISESPHKVTLTRGFYMGAYLVTQKQWQGVMKSNPSHFRGDNLPVEQVSWEMCQDFIKKLRDMDHKHYRLPTEAEWEWACRAGTTTPFNVGDVISTDYANYNGKYAYKNSKPGVLRDRTTPVDSFPPNAWGLHDMHGNVAQWCQDWFEDYPQKALVDPQGPEKGQKRVMRGGSWNDAPWNCRSAYRIRWKSDFYSREVGLRLCFSLD